MTTEERFEKLERELAIAKNALRRNRQILVLGVVAVLGCLTLAAVRDTQVIRAKKFIVTDNQGRDRGEFEMNGRDPELALLNENGYAYALLENFGGGAVLRLADGAGKTHAQLIVTDGGSGLSLSDEKGENVGASAIPELGMSIALSDENGRNIWDAPGASGVGAPSITGSGSADSSLWEDASAAANAAASDASAVSGSLPDGWAYDNQRAAWDASSKAWEAIGIAAHGMANP